MGAKTTQIKIINQACNYHDITNLKNFESRFSKINRKQALIKRIDDYERICSVIAPLYWIFSFPSGHTKEKPWNKYLNFDNFFTENKDLL